MLLCVAGKINGSIYWLYFFVFWGFSYIFCIFYKFVWYVGVLCGNGLVAFNKGLREESDDCYMLAEGLRIGLYPNSLPNCKGICLFCYKLLFLSF